MGLVLVLGLRGIFVRVIWLDVVGFIDLVLVRRIDLNFLCVLFGGVFRDECLLFFLRNFLRVYFEFIRWFVGRVFFGGVIDVGILYIRKDYLRFVLLGRNILIFFVYVYLFDRMFLILSLII